MKTLWQRLSTVTAEMRRSPIFTEKTATYYLSPFQVPNAWRQDRDPTTGDITIQFRYPDDGEPTRELTVKDGVCISIGRISSRIFAIKLPKALIHEAIERVLTESHATNRVAAGAIDELKIDRGADNHRVARQLFERDLLKTAAL